MVMRFVILASVLSLTLAACGKSEEQKAAEKAAEDVKQAAEAIADAAAKTGTAAAAQATTDVAKAMQGMAAALGAAGSPDGKPVDPIAFQTLQTHLPTVDGWERGEVEGERMTMPVPFSQVETQFRKGESRIDVKIVDTGFAQMLIAPWSMMLAAGYSRESTNGYEKATTVSGNPAIEKWDARQKRGELNVLVGKRYMVSFEGRRLDDIKDVQAFASATDFGKIAALK
jgi:hypothetical protein